MEFSNENVFIAISSILEDMGIKTDDFTEHTCLEADLGMDSQEVVEFQFALEKRYHIRFPAGFLNRDLAVRDLIEKFLHLTNCVEQYSIS